MAEVLRRAVDDPVVFSRALLGFEPWSKQAEIMRLVAAHNRVAVRSGQKTGKTRTAAALAIWWAVTRPNANVVLTAPTYQQVKEPIWKDVRFLASHSRFPLSPSEPALDPGTGWQVGPNSSIRGRTTDRPERMQGLSGHDSLYIVDEATGYPESILEAIFGNLAGGGKLLLISNPNNLFGTFYDAFHTKKHLWETLLVRSIDSPNFKGGNVPGLATQGWIDEQAENWGEGSQAYQVRVLGEFASNVSNAIIALGLIEAAAERHPTTQPDGPLVLGVDVARFGDDDSVIAPRRGRKILPLRTLHGQDSIQLAGAVAQVARELRVEGERPVANIDVIGVGAGVYDQLASAHKDVVEAVAINVAESSDDVERYSNLRTQLLFGLAQWLKDGGAIPRDDKKLAGELAATQYKYDARGRSQAQPKDEVRELLRRSPDRADAVALSVYTRRWRVLPVVRLDRSKLIGRGIPIEERGVE